MSHMQTVIVHIATVTLYKYKFQTYHKVHWVFSHLTFLYWLGYSSMVHMLCSFSALKFACLITIWLLFNLLTKVYFSNYPSFLWKHYWIHCWWVILHVLIFHMNLCDSTDIPLQFLDVSKNKYLVIYIMYASHVQVCWYSCHSWLAEEGSSAVILI